MSWFTNLFGSKANPASGSGNTAPTLRRFTERDNRGTRQDTVEKANAYWVGRMTSPKKDPFVLYAFATEGEARAALLEVPCIHLADDTQQLIATEVLTFGYYRADDGRFEAIICGDDLSHELWEQARASFSKHGGTRKNDLEPQRRAAAQSAVKPRQAGKVDFVREDRENRGAATMIYRVHKAPDAATAKAFLEEHPVTQQFYYIVVETPEGNYCRDIQGMYKE
jgi:hypothetical protein